MTDAEIVAQARAGNREAYSRLVERYRQAIYGLAYHHLQNSDNAQDVAQIAFLYGYQHLEQLRNPSAFGAWLRQIAVSQCQMWRRQTNSLLINDHALHGCEFPIRQAENRLLVQQTLACLSPSSRLTLTLFYLRSYSLQEIATFLNVPVTTVKSRLRNARARIRKEHWDMVEQTLTPLPMNRDFVWQVMRKLNSGVARSVAFSPDGKWLASGRLDGAITLWDARTGTVARTWAGHARAVDELAFSPDSATLVSASRDRTICLWDAQSGVRRVMVTDGGRPASITFSPDGSVLAHTSYVLDSQYRVVCSRAALRDVQTGNITRELDTRFLCAPPEMVPPESGNQKGMIFHIAFSPDGTMLATGDSLSREGHEPQDFWGGQVTLWDAQTGAPLRTLAVPDFMVKSVDFSPDGQVLAAACTQLEWNSGASDEEGELIQSQAQLWRVSDGALVRTLGEQPQRAAQQVTFSPDGALLAVYYWNESGNETQVFDWQTGARLQTFAQMGRSRTTIAFSPDSKTLASGSDDENVTLWQIGRF